MREYYKPYNPADLNWHTIDEAMIKRSGSLEADADYRWVNFNTSGLHSAQHQYAIYLKDKGVSSIPKFKDDLGYNLPIPSCQTSNPYFPYTNPLKCHYTCAIYVTRLVRWVDSAPEEQRARLYNEQLTTTVIHELGHAVGIRHHNNPAMPDKPDDNWTDDGVRNCAMRYEHASEKKPSNSFLKTRYCKLGESYVAWDGSGKYAGHNCYGQINIKGD